MSTKILNREDILAAKQTRKTIEIQDIPGMDASVFIQQLSRAEFKAWFEQFTDADDAKTVAAVLCDESGSLLLNPENQEDVTFLESSFPAKALAHIATRAFVENSANPQLVQKNLQASLNTVLSTA